MTKIKTFFVNIFIIKIKKKKESCKFSAKTRMKIKHDKNLDSHAQLKKEIKK